MEQIKAILTLDEVPDEYTFTIDRRGALHILHIPGDHRGPDLCFPDRPEQEEWLNSLTDLMKPFWYCQWEFKSKKACDGFIEFLMNPSSQSAASINSSS